jgi:hypothetical protein
MTPLDAYRDTAARARTFLLYHDGLMNTRKRKIRKDWRASFLKLMHWPSTAAIDRVDSKDVTLILKSGSQLRKDHFSADHLDDMLRAALTFGVSALDRYVHERVIKGFIKSLKATNLTRQQEEFSIPVTTAIQISEAALAAHKAGKNTRTANIVRKKVQELLHRRPFQSWRELEYAFCLLGVTNMGGQLQAAYGVGNIGPIKAQLNQIAARRNSIVHEGDLVKHERGGKVKMLAISRKYVSDTLDFLDMLVGHLENVN